MKKLTPMQIPADSRFLAVILLITLLAACSGPESYRGNDLPRSTPEAEGVTTQSIISFLDAVEAGDQELHSFMYLRNGKVIAEGWWDPYQPDLRHTLYSTSKSFTSTAIGFAVSEGLLTVDDPVISFFPDRLPDTVSENLAAMTVKHLLTMAAGQDPPPNLRTVGPGESWITAFLAYPVAKEPGSEFMYNSHATYMLSAIITELTGETVLDYLRPRLFEPLGIDGMDWETDPEGITSGGWGLRLKTEDMTKFGQLFLQEGSWNGEQLLPEAWIEKATSMQIDQAPGASYHARKGNDWRQGYGYQFWRSQHGFYRADGAFGQYILVMPDRQAVMAVTSESSDMQKVLNMVFDHILPGMHDEPIDPDDDELAILEERLAALSLPAPESGTNDSLMQEVDGTRYAFARTEEGWVTGCSFDFDDGALVAGLTDTSGMVHEIAAGSGAWVTGETMVPGPNLVPFYEANADVLLPAKIASAYRWTGPGTLELVVRYIESPHSLFYTFTFAGNEVQLRRSASMGLLGNPPVSHGTKAES